MYINSEIVKAFLEGEDVSKYRDLWYFTNSEIATDQGKNIFQMPDCNEEQVNQVKFLYHAIENKVKEFEPTNIAIWNVLTPDWRNVISEVDVDLIIGYPQPYDATVLKDEQGKRHVIFDLLCWTKYIGQCDVENLVQNLLTHELFHVLIGRYISNIDDDLESKDYLTRLDAIAFHEAFAHLISFEAQEITTVNWHLPVFEDAKKKCNQRFYEALRETDIQKQQQNLYDAVCGNYLDKFACISGMLYLAAQWENGGIPKLNEVFQAGYHGFAKKASESTK